MQGAGQGPSPGVSTWGFKSAALREEAQQSGSSRAAWKQLFGGGEQHPCLLLSKRALPGTVSCAAPYVRALEGCLMQEAPRDFASNPALAHRDSGCCSLRLPFGPPVFFLQNLWSPQPPSSDLQREAGALPGLGLKSPICFSVAEPEEKRGEGSHQRNCNQLSSGQAQPPAVGAGQAQRGGLPVLLSHRRRPCADLPPRPAACWGRTLLGFGAARLFQQSLHN